MVLMVETLVVVLDVDVVLGLGSLMVFGLALVCGVLGFGSDGTDLYGGHGWVGHG